MIAFRAPARPTYLLPLTLAVLALGAGVFILEHRAQDAIESGDVLGTIAGWAFVWSGAYSWVRRPTNRLGPLLVLAGLFWLVGGVLRQFDAAPAFTIGVFLGDLWTAVFFWVLLAVPDGRVSNRFDRVVAGFVFLAVGPLELAWLLFWDVSANVLAVWPDKQVAGHIDTAQRVILVTTTLVLAVVLSRRWLSASRPLRWALAPAVIGAASLLVGASINVLDKLAVEFPQELRDALLVTLAMVPIAVIAGALHIHMARASVTGLLLQLRQDSTLADLRGPLARALGDPKLSLSYWLPKFGYYVDTNGTRTEVGAVEPGRATTVIERGGKRIAAIEHDATLSSEPQLLDAVTVAAGLALENGQLQAELEMRLVELAGSRARVLEAGQAERKRLERNLHDGTQQRLIVLAMELSVLERRLRDDPDTRSRVEHARHEITESLAELRDVARGLYPATLTLHGLASALRSVAAGAAVPVRLRADLPERFPEPIEVAAYYVVSEALANVGKHAPASTATVTVDGRADGISVEVCDTGDGGADAQRGSGLRGLIDRVEALGGRLTVDDAPGGGTRVHADLPSSTVRSEERRHFSARPVADHTSASRSGPNSDFGT